MASHLKKKNKKKLVHQGEVESHICTLSIQCNLFFDLRGDCCLHRETDFTQTFVISAFAGWKMNQTMC